MCAARAAHMAVYQEKARSRSAGGWTLSIRWRDANGHRQRKRLRFPTEKAAQAEASRLQRERFDLGLEPFPPPAPAPKKKPTVAFLFGWRAQFFERKETPASCYRFEQHRRIFQRFAIWNRDAEAVAEGDLEDFVHARLTEKVPVGESYRKDRREARQMGRQAGRDTVGKDLSVLRSILNAALRAPANSAAKIGSHVFQTMTKAKREELIPKWSADQTVGKVIATADWERILAAFPEDGPNRCLRFLWYAGARFEQGAGLDWRTYKDLPAPGFDLIRQKKGERFLKMTPVLREIVGERRRKSGKVFDVDSAWLKREWHRRVRKGLGLAYRIHDIRHSVGTRLRDKFGLGEAASALNITMATARTYANHHKHDLDAAHLDAAHENGRALGAQDTDAR
jgi:integrase